MQDKIGEKTRPQRFVENIRRLITRNRFASGYTETPFSAVESLILLYIESGEGTTSTELIPLIQYDQASLSRVIGRLVKAGYVSSTPSAADKRVHTLALTRTGKSAFLEADSRFNRHSFSLYDSLSNEERNVFYRAFHAFADFCGVSPSQPRPGEHASRCAVRRFTAASGFLGESFLDSELNSVRWTLLETLRAHEEPPVTAQVLSDGLGLAKPNVDYILRKLLEADQITRTAAPKDKRQYLLALSEQGRLQCKINEKRAWNMLLQGLSSFEMDEIDLFLDVFDRLTQLPAGHPLKIDAAPHEARTAPTQRPLSELTITTVDDKETRRRTRSYLVRQLVLHNLEDHTPESLASFTDYCVVLTVKDTIVGALQVTQSPDPTLALCFIDENLREALGQSFLHEGIQNYLADHPEQGRPFIGKNIGNVAPPANKRSPESVQ